MERKSLIAGNSDFFFGIVIIVLSSVLWGVAKTITDAESAVVPIIVIVFMAETHYISVAPHNPSGPVANAATLQLAGNISNFCILEIMLTDVTWRKELTTEKVVFDNGDIVIPDKPGLGLDLDEIACGRNRNDLDDAVFE